MDLSLGALLERFYQPEVVQAAWDDVVDAFAEGQTAEVGEYCIAVLRELCEARGHKWSDLGLAYQLTRLLSDDIAVAVAAGAVDGETVSDWGATAGLSEEERLSLCRVAVAAEAARGDVAVWLLFVEAYVEGWQRLGPVQLFDAHLMPDGIRAGGALGGFDDYEAPPELGDWDADSVYSGDLGVPVGEHAVLARVWLPETLVELAPQRARVLVQTLVEVANDDSRWVLKDGEAAHRVGGDWYGSLGFDDPAVLRENRRSLDVIAERTRDALTLFNDSFVERLVNGDAAAAEAIEDLVQRVALGTRALERTLGIAQAVDEDWADVTTRYLLAPWVALERSRWVQCAAISLATPAADG